jgi:uncharacterized SAM-binding protein YcdF (DUF218 family)
VIKSIIAAAFKVGAGLLIFFTATFFIYAAVIILWDRDAMDDIQTHDAIIVLTGGEGRIPSGFELLLAEKADKLLISGVLGFLSKEEILFNNASAFTEEDQEDLKNHCCIELDYIADTTETNAIESAKWIKDNNVKSIILVTSDYHMPRSYMLFSVALNEDILITAYPYDQMGRIYNLANTEFWRYATAEYIKFIGSLFRLRRLNEATQA